MSESEAKKQVETAAEAEQVADMVAFVGDSEPEQPGQAPEPEQPAKVLCVWRGYKADGEEVIQATVTSLTDLKERAQAGLGQMPIEGQSLTKMFEVSGLVATLSVFKLES